MPIGIKAYKIDTGTGTWATTPFFSAPTVRSGTDITLGEDLEFDLASINSEDDFEDLDIRIKIVITNPNNVKMGVYFSNEVVSQNAYDKCNSRYR